MIFVDDRAGSAQLARYLSPSSLCRMEYGDVYFIGNGPNGPVPVGIEVKSIGDFLNSIQTGRLSGHQLPGLVTSYEHVYLIIYGLQRGNVDTGLFEVWSQGRWVPAKFGRQFMSREVWNYLNTLEVITHVYTRMVKSAPEAASLIQSLYSWWGKPFEEHQGHIGIYHPPRPGFSLKAPDIKVRVAAEFPGLGLMRARAAGKYFTSVAEMVMADEKKWAQVEGVGKKTARQIVNALWGRKGD